MALCQKLKDLKSSQVDKPAQWCSSLIASGHKQDLLAMDASVRSSLGADCEKLLRSCQVLVDYEQVPEKQPEIFRNQLWEDKNTLRAGVLALLDLQSGVEAPTVDEVKQILLSKLLKSIQSLNDKFFEAKRVVRDTYQLVVKVQEKISSGEDFDAAVTEANEHEDEVKELVEGVDSFLLVDCVSQ